MYKATVRLALNYCILRKNKFSAIALNIFLIKLKVFSLFKYLCCRNFTENNYRQINVSHYRSEIIESYSQIRGLQSVYF